MSESPHRSGFIAVIGKPNVGKSTLINALVGHKISIVTSKPHTTRHAIMGVLTEPDYQMVFIDTPGIEGTFRQLMNKTMNRAAVGATEGANLIMFVIDSVHWNAGDDKALELVRRSGLPCILIVNKVDRVKPREKLLPILNTLISKFDFVEVVPLSALKDNNLDRLKGLLLQQLPEEEPLYPAEMLTDRGIRFQVAEVLREKLMELLRQEVPYGLGVEVNEYGEDERGLLCIDTIIWVDRESHKGIVIGKGGEVLKKVGIAARQDLEERLQRKLHLESHVRVKKNWADNAQMLKQMGYDGEL